MKHDDLGDRMKKYESVTRSRLVLRTPVIIRLDGNAFHTFTKGFQKPFDPLLMDCMQRTMKYLCENIQGCVFGYTQSDEITLVLTDYKKLNSSSWFDYNIQKCASIAASMATMAFNKNFNDSVWFSWSGGGITNLDDPYYESLEKAKERGAMFDARCFNIPKEEVCNNLIWRQNDAARNSVQMVAQHYFSHKELQGKSCNEIKDMLRMEKDITWFTNYSWAQKYGACCRKVLKEGRRIWIIDDFFPLFKEEGRRMIDELVSIGD